MNKKRPFPFKPTHADGFTLIELLVVVATVGLLAMVLLPALAATKPDSQSFQCLENQRQLVRAWQMYAEDNNDLLPPNDYPWKTSFVQNDYVANNPAWGSHHRNWVVGSMNPACPLDTADSYAQFGKSMYLDPNTVLSPYQTNRAGYHCPADNFTSHMAPHGHTRSYSMNSGVGTIYTSAVENDNTDSQHRHTGAPVDGAWLPGATYTSGQTTWLTYGKMSSFSRPGPANTFVIMDENPFTINDASIAIPAAATPGNTWRLDFPSGNHNKGAGISFADGHVLIYKWQDARTYTPTVPEGGQISSSGLQTPDNPDCFYLASITSARR